MSKKDPEEQRLENESIEPAEELTSSSGESALNDSQPAGPDSTEPSEESAQEPASTEVEQAEAEEQVAAAGDVDADAGTEQPEGETAAISEAPTEQAADEQVEAEGAPAAESPAEANSGQEAEAPAAEGVEEPSTDAEAGDLEESPLSAEDESGAAWFVVHCYSGYENKVRHNLEQRIETMGMKDMIFDVVVPTQEEIEVRDGKRRTVERHIFPGYVLVNMVLTEESWYVVRNTPGVTGFVGMGNTPTPLRPEEVVQIVKRMEAEAPTIKVTFKVGERVRIIDGPFNDFRGVVAEIDMERTKVRVMVSFFGRETPVELDFLQVEKA